jgi:hypothetical protein
LREMVFPWPQKLCPLCHLPHHLRAGCASDLSWSGGCHHVLLFSPRSRMRNLERWQVAGREPLNLIGLSPELWAFEVRSQGSLWHPVKLMHPFSE